MKLKSSHFLTVGIMFISLGAMAQEDVTPVANNEATELSEHPELNLNDDKTLIMDFDSKTSKAIHTPGTTNQKSKPETSPKSVTAAKPEEDTLSFNFLYYIIQKFKFSDILD